MKILLAAGVFYYFKVSTRNMQDLVRTRPLHNTRQKGKRRQPYLLGMDIIQLPLDPLGRHIRDDVGPGIRCTRVRQFPGLQILRDTVDYDTETKSGADNLGACNWQIREVG